MIKVSINNNLLILIFSILCISCKSNIYGLYKYDYPLGDNHIIVHIKEDQTFNLKFKDFHTTGTSSGKWERYGKDTLVFDTYKKPLNTYEIIKKEKTLQNYKVFIAKDDTGYPLPSANFTIFSNKGEDKRMSTNEGLIKVNNELIIDSLIIEYLGFKTINYQIEENISNYYEFHLSPIAIEEIEYWFLENEKMRLSNKKLYYKDLELEKIRNSNGGNGSN